MFTEKWPQNRNIFWIEQQLFATCKAERQTELLKLLDRELDALAQGAETLGLLDHLISRCRNNIERQRETIAVQEQLGRDTSVAKQVLAGMLATLALYLERHVRVSKRC